MRPRTVWRPLNREGRRVARCTVERVMRARRLRGAVRGRAWKTTTQSDPAATRPADLVVRQFTATRPNQRWVADFTDGATWRGFAAWFVIDVFARSIVGWRVSTSLATDFVLDALEQAIDDRCGTNVQDLIHHSDRGGTRYLSMRYSERLAEAGIAPSVGSRGDSYDAMAEWIIGLFKTEVIQRKGPWRHLEAVEFATLGWVLLQYAPAPRAHRLRPAAEYDAQYYAQRMPTPPLIQLHGGALVGSHLPTTALTGRPSSARMTFFDD